MLAITIGLLIALGLEASVEWLHHRSLVREARENMSQEIRDNQRNLATELKALPGESQQLQGILEMAGDAQHARPAKQPNDFRWTVIRLSESAWNTAASSGLSPTRRYAQLYELQQMFNANMDRYVDSC